MDTIHQSGMGMGGSTLPPDQLSRISPTAITGMDNLFVHQPLVVYLCTVRTSLGNSPSIIEVIMYVSHVLDRQLLIG